MLAELAARWECHAGGQTADLFTGDRPPPQWQHSRVPNQGSLKGDGSCTSTCTTRADAECLGRVSEAKYMRDLPSQLGRTDQLPNSYPDTQTRAFRASKGVKDIYNASFGYIMAYDHTIRFSTVATHVDLPRFG